MSEDKQTKRHLRCTGIVLFVFSLCCALNSQSVFQDRLTASSIIGITRINNVNFREYYEIMVVQRLDHFRGDKTFQQRIFVGFRDFQAPTVVQTDGYAINYAGTPNYNNELSMELQCNLVVIEHRYFGRSVPDSLDWNLLTTQQAAADCHYIKSLLDTVLSGPWMSTGISKGGQAALAYRMYYPDDVNATVVYGTAVKGSRSVLTDSLHLGGSDPRCSDVVQQFQLFALQHKSRLLPVFTQQVQHRYDFTPLTGETVFEYLLLEFPFSFWQNGHRCEEMPDTTASDEVIVEYIMKVVPPQFFSAGNRVSLEPAFYMFYHEFGYYEYSTTPFAPWLSQSEYPNSFFAPKNVQINFDSTYQNELTVFLRSNRAGSIFFVYGEHDPWALQTEATSNVTVVPGGNHKSRIANLQEEPRALLFGRIRSFLK